MVIMIDGSEKRNCESGFWTLELTWILGFTPLIPHPTFLWNFRSNIEQFACLTDATSATIFNKIESTIFECQYI